MKCSIPGVRTARYDSLGSVLLAMALPRLGAQGQLPCRRLTSTISKASMTEVTTSRLTKQDLVDYLSSGCKPQSQFRCAQVLAAHRSVP